MSKAEQRRVDLYERAKQASEGPGVYRMLDSHKQIIYIGKAKNLRNRVKSYFQASGNDERPKTKMMVLKVFDFETILTDSEAEALILECILIKKHRPRYNIALKDDKTYPYLLVDRSHTFPKLSYARRFKKQKQLEVFGPYVSAGALRQAIQFLSQSFRLRTCSDTEFSNRSRPCMNYQIGVCSAPCTSYISPEGYQADLSNALHILQGQGLDVIQGLEGKMESFSESLEFEQAARIRDQVDSLKLMLLENSQKIEENSVNRLGDDDKDVIGFHRNADAAGFAVAYVRDGKLIDSTTFFLTIPEDKKDSEVLLDFLAQFYLARDHFPGEQQEREGKNYLPGTEVKKIPPEILLPMDLEENENIFIESLKRFSINVTIKTPKRGAKSDLLKMAEKNAIEALASGQNKLGDIYRALSDLKTKAMLQNYPRRIECFDISNLGDTGIVASRVVFIEGKAEKSLYRHYKMREVRTQDDFASMREVLSRRLQKSSKYAEESSEEAPDLLVVDGGKGQLAMAAQVIKELDITGIDLISLAKAKTESDFAATDVVASSERIFKPGRMNPIVLAPGTGPCAILTRIRDEAHRFAITFQREQRTTQLKKKN